MASKKETLDYVLALLGGIGDISSRKMMGEYLIYYKGKVVGGIYDDRFLVKKTPHSILLLPDIEEQQPYEGAKMMFSLSDIVFDEHPEDIALLKQVFEAIYEDIK